MRLGLVACKLWRCITVACSSSDRRCGAANFALEQADAMLQAEIEKDAQRLLSYALGIVVRQLRE